MKAAAASKYVSWHGEYLNARAQFNYSPFSTDQTKDVFIYVIKYVLHTPFQMMSMKTLWQWAYK